LVLVLESHQVGDVTLLSSLEGSVQLLLESLGVAG
jgi:hypothetical protein